MSVELYRFDYENYPLKLFYYIVMMMMIKKWKISQIGKSVIILPQVYQKKNENSWKDVCFFLNLLLYVFLLIFLKKGNKQKKIKNHSRFTFQKSFKESYF